jgi:hypothetical protein
MWVWNVGPESTAQLGTGSEGGDGRMDIGLRGPDLLLEQEHLEPSVSSAQGRNS